MGLLSSDRYDVYLAGPFFNERQKETMDVAKTVLQGKGLVVCDPRDLSPVLVDMLPEERRHHTRNIFANNIRAMEDSYAIVACIDDRDTGTAFELGFCYQSRLVAEHFSGDSGPIITFSGFGYGANVMLAEATDAHFLTIEEMSSGLDLILPALKQLGEGPMEWAVFISDVLGYGRKAEATE